MKREKKEINERVEKESEEEKDVRVLKREDKKREYKNREKENKGDKSKKERR